MKLKEWVWNNWEIGLKEYHIPDRIQLLKNMFLPLIKDTVPTKTFLNSPRKLLKPNHMLLNLWVMLLTDNQLVLKKQDLSQTFWLRWTTIDQLWTRKTLTQQKIFNLWAKLLLIRTILWSLSRLTNLDSCSKSMKNSKRWTLTKRLFSLSLLLKS